jgi:chromosome segregation ATPase
MNDQLLWFKNRLYDLERELKEAKDEKLKLFSKLNELEQSVEVKELNRQKLEKTNEQQSQELSEISKKLNSKIDECSKLSKNLHDTDSQLRISRLKLQQMETTGTGTELAATIQAFETEKEKLFNEKQSLDVTVNRLKDQMNTLIEDHNAKISHYDDFLKELQHRQKEVSDLTAQLTQLRKEKEAVENRVIELDAKLTAEKAEHVSSCSIDEKIRLEEIVATLSSAIAELQKRDAELTGQNENLRGELSRAVGRISSLELELEEEKRLTGDKEGLLSSVASEQVAASRALAQNRAMKKQMDELQDAFIKMSHSKMSFADQYENEKRVNQLLSEKLHDGEEEVKGLR